MNKRNFFIALFIIGLFILLFPHIAKFLNELKFKDQAEDFLEMEIPEDEVVEIIEKAKQCNKEIFLNVDAFRDPFNYLNSDVDDTNECVKLVGEDVFAILEIPKLDLMVPIYLGSTKEILNRGVGQVVGSSLPVGGESTHTVLAGHRGMPLKEMFLNLDRVVQGDVFYIHTKKDTLTYKVYAQNVIDPSDPELLEIQEGKDLATLITCHPKYYNYQRLLIQGERVE